MKQITVQDLSAHSFFTDSVFLDGKYILLSPDIPFSKEMKSRLIEWGFVKIFSEGEMADSAPAPIVGEDGEPAAVVPITLEDEEQKKDAVSFFQKTVAFLEEAFDRFKVKGELRVMGFNEKVKEISSVLKSNSRYILSLEDEDSQASTYLTTHSVKTAILSLAIADYMKLPPFKQIDLGMAAFLHQIGLLKMPEQLYLTDKQLSPQEKKALVAHPVVGFRILKAAGFPLQVCAAVLEHNERIDGSGLPRQISGDKISLFGRILAVASSYNAAVSKRPYKPGIDGHSGMMDLLKDAGKRYDERVCVALVYTLSLYPIGTYLKLSNGAIALVVKSNPEDPRHPIVKMLVDEQGNPYPQQPILHTQEGGEVTIERALNKEELQKVQAF